MKSEEVKYSLSKYIKEKGLTLQLVAQEMHVSRQALAKYGTRVCPRASTIKKVAAAMTNLGVPTKPIDIVKIFYPSETEEE